MIDFYIAITRKSGFRVQKTEDRKVSGAQRRWIATARGPRR
jgi:hypothetical protein